MVPGIRIAAPRDEPSLRELLWEAVGWSDGPTVLRFPKTPLGADLPALRRVGDHLDVLREPAQPDVLLVSVGAMAHTCVEIADRIGAEGYRATVVDPRWVTPVEPALPDLAARHRLVVTVEDGVRVGGVGTRVAQALRDAGIDVPCREVGVPAVFPAHGTVAQVRTEIGLTAQDVARNVVEWMAKLDGSAAPQASAAEAPTDQPADS
jgi:1-deoxy-D-xylulose-5-phosphate synthase